jgi:G6PDH family F420-dependent oxidoreductase
LFDLPEQPIPLLVSAFGPASAKLAARVGDGVWTTGPSDEIVRQFEQNGGHGAKWTQLTMCWAPTKDQAIDIAHRVWPTSAVPGQLSQDLPTPEHFVQATKIVTRDMVAESFPCGPDLTPVVDAVRQASENGFDHVYLHQIGPDQEGFLRAWDNELREALRGLREQPVPV